MLGELANPKGNRTDKQNKDAVRFETVYRVILSSLTKITVRTTCPVCKDLSKCLHLNSYDGWNTWWKKHVKNFKIQDL